MLLGLWTSTARADDARAPASDAQPGLYRVGLAEVGRAALAATLGYGYTEKQNGDDGAHHRLSLRAAAALPVTSWLGVGPVLDGRHDIHPGDSGTIVSGGVVARAAARQGSLRFGAEVKPWVPGAEKVSTMFDATSLDVRALVGGVVGKIDIAGVVGYRLDRTAAAGKDAAGLSPGDRLALGLSDFDALLLGLGVSVPLGPSELFGEVSSDVLVGSGAPSFRQSPLRLALGARHGLSAALALELLAEGSLSAKPDLSATAPLVPNEPRFSVLLGLRYRFLPAPAARAEQAPPPPPPVVAPPPPVAAPVDAAVAITVHDDQGGIVSSATAAVVLDTVPRELTGDGAGHYKNEHVAPGNAVLRVEASGFEPLERPVTIRAGVPLELEVTLKALPPPSQIRGLIRNLSGKGLAAKIRFEPSGVETATDADGAFRVDLPPGEYDVAIEAPGYAKQRRHVKVDPQGVVILNAELVKQK